MKFPLLVLLLFSTFRFAVADGPADNIATTVRPIPPLGVKLSDDQSDLLTRRCEEVRLAWAELLSTAALKSTTGNQYEKARQRQIVQTLNDLTPEILVFPRAIELALER